MQESIARTNIIKLRFTKGGEPSGREYTYFTPIDVEVGEIVELESRGGVAKGIVTQINVPKEEVASFRNRMKTIIGKVQEKAKEEET